MRLRCAWVALAGIVLGSACLADNSPTQEQEAATALAAGRFPMALSGDGKWIFHVDADDSLHRKSTSGLGKNGAIKLGMRVYAVSASRSGNKVALLGPSDCLAIVTFADAGQPAVAWFTSPHFAMPANGSCGKRKPTDESGFTQFAGASMALSSDAKWLAIAADGVKVIDVEHPEKAWHIASNIRSLRVRFVDDDKKLLVIQAKMGVGEVMPLPGSNVQFDVWDLKKKELFNLHATADADYINEFDLLSTYSDSSGEALLFTSKHPWFEMYDGKPRPPVTAYSIDLKRCGASKLTRPSIPHELWTDTAADPYGRWSAAVSGDTLLLRDRAGKVLMRRRLSHGIGTLTPSRDGNTLFGVTLAMNKNRPGGELKSIDLSAAIAALARVESQWPGERCLVEDEAPQAREIAIDTGLPTALSKTVLAYQLSPSEENEDRPCGGQEFSPSRRWHLKPDGTMLNDSGTSIELRNPANGQLLRRLATPRSKTVCSTPDWKENRFLNWQGDTISASPLEAGTDMSERKLLVRMPGWRATLVEALGARFGVRWVSSPCNLKRGDKEGRALAITYDKWGKELSREVGSGENCYPEFTQDEYGPALFKLAEPAPAKYRWQLSYGGSVRARTGQPGRTVLWSGLTMTPAGISQELADETGFVQDLGSGLGAHFHAGLVDVYDAAARRRVARIKLNNPVEAAWHEASRTLLIEHRESDGDEKTLRAFRIN